MNKAKEMVILVGPSASGKTTYCVNKLPNHYRISQDEMGRGKHYELFLEALKSENLIVVDRMNHLAEQRARYIEPAKKAGFKVVAVVFDVDYKTCFERAKKRTKHPTLKSSDERAIQVVLGSFFKYYEPVQPSECKTIVTVKIDQQKNS